MKTKILKWLLGALGFSAMLSSCEGGIINNGQVEYGTPHVNFTLKGKVSDQELNPIKGIKVSYKVTDYGENEGLSNLSDDKGNYSINDPYMFPPGDYRAVLADITAEDIDGEENGSFKTQTITVSLSDVVFTGGNGSWYQGSGEKAVDFVLEPADEPADEQGGKTLRNEKQK